MKYQTREESNGTRLWYNESNNTSFSLNIHHILRIGDICNTALVHPIDSYKEVHLIRMICRICNEQHVMYHNEEGPAIVYDGTYLKTKWWYYEGRFVFDEKLT